MPAGVEEQLEDGWTRVGRGKGHSPHHVYGLDPPAKGVTVEHLRADFDAKTKRWCSSACRRELLAILDRQQPDGGWQLTKAVCLATNSFSRDNFQGRQRSMMQFAAFFDMTQHLQSWQSGPIEISAQEPNYTPLESDFLGSLGVQVLDSYQSNEHTDGLGEAKNHITPSTFVFEAFMDLDPESMHELFGGDPRLYVGSFMERWRELRQRSNAQTLADLKRHSRFEPAQGNVERKRERSQLAAQFVDSRRAYRFPRYEEDPNIFEGLLIYWKEPMDAEEGQA